MMIGILILFFCLGGCGKKADETDVSTEGSVEELSEDMYTTEMQFDDGTLNENEVVYYDLDPNDKLSFWVNNDTMLMHFDVSDIDNNVNKIIPVRKKAMNKETYETFYQNVFDERETMISGRGVDSDGDFIFLDGTTEGFDIYGFCGYTKYWYCYNRWDGGTDIGTYRYEVRQLDYQDSPLDEYHIPVLSSEQVTNKCNKADATAIAEDWMSRMGYDDYELVNVIDTKKYMDYSDGMEVNGYEFSYSRVIDGTYAPDFYNIYFYRDGDEYPIVREKIILYITDKGLILAKLPLEYEMQGQATECEIIPLDTALEIAKERIKSDYENMRTGFIAYGADEMTYKVSLSYIPIETDGSIEYTPTYLFIYQDLTDEKYFVQCAVSAVNGELIESYYVPGEGMR